MKRFVTGVALALAVAACSGGSSPEGVVETFMLSLQEGRCDGIGDNLSVSSRRMAGSKIEAVCRQGVLKDRSGKQLSAMKLIDKQEDGDRATLNLQRQYADGSTGEPQRFAMVREDGAWKLDLIAMGRGRVVRALPGAGPATNGAAAATNTQ